jgi:hypothetical protein
VIPPTPPLVPVQTVNSLVAARFTLRLSIHLNNIRKVAVLMELS